MSFGVDLRRLLAACGLAVCACGRTEPPPSAPADATVAVAPEPSHEPPAPPEFSEDTRSLRLIRSAGVWLAPGENGKRIGTVAQDTRVGWTRTARDRGCTKAWVEIAPRGWVCGEYLEASTRAPSGVELPRLERGEVVPGTYGKVVDEGAMVYGLPEARPGKAPAGPAGPGKDAPVASPGEVDPAAAPPPALPRKQLVPVRPLLGSVNVRKFGEMTVGGKAYWKVSRGNEYVLARSIHEHEASTFGGIRLGDDSGLSLPIAFVWPKPRGVTKAWVRRNAKGQGALRQVEQRTPFPVLETHEDNGKVIAYRIGDGEWLLADTVRIATAAEPPPLIGEHERWFDVDLDTQILVAYEGRTPVYVTMVSTGKDATPTPPGIWRIWKKVSETDMKGLSGEDPYSVATVPWTEFFDPLKGFALHAVYWHDGYGTQRSHGCINLAPLDARWLYFWSEPILPPGWTMAAGVIEAPGSIVRVRSKAAPIPLEYKGYAKKVQEAREANQPPRVD